MTVIEPFSIAMYVQPKMERERSGTERERSRMERERNGTGTGTEPNGERCGNERITVY